MLREIATETRLFQRNGVFYARVWVPYEGHKNATVSRAYGSAGGYPLVPLYASIKQLRFE